MYPTFTAKPFTWIGYPTFTAKPFTWIGYPTFTAKPFTWIGYPTFTAKPFTWIGYPTFMTKPFTWIGYHKKLLKVFPIDITNRLVYSTISTIGKMYQKKFDLITAINKDGLIGIKEYGVHSLPWPLLKEDMDFFRRQTTCTEYPKQINAIIIGYNTWKSLSNLYKNNSKRVNIIVSNQPTVSVYGSEIYADSLEHALTIANNLENMHKIYVIGGAAMYNIALEHPSLDQLHITLIDKSYPVENDIESQVYFPLAPHIIQSFVERQIISLKESKSINDIGKAIKYHINTYTTSESFVDVYKSSPKLDRIVNLPKQNQVMRSDGEHQYLNLIRTILDYGIYKTTRNSITKSIFGHQLRYDLAIGYPISTVKKSYPKAVFEELMWMLRGQTDVNILKQKNVHIWDKNSSKEFLEKNNLPYDEGDIGPGYGFQMRHFGANYDKCTSDYSNQGVDQLNHCINLIKNDPHSRRIIMNLWNATDLDLMALPPCHVMYQFTVDLYDNSTNNKNHGKLNCHLIQRSWDVMLGWNTTTAALLTYILANHCDLDPGILVHSITDVHLYKSHIDSGAIDKLLERKPRAMPTISFLKKRTNIEDYEFDDIVIENYYPCPPISAEMIA